MADEQNKPNGSFEFSGNLSEQLPEMPQADEVNAPIVYQDAAAQNQEAPVMTAQSPSPVYAPTVQSTPLFQTQKPSAFQTFFTKPLGKILLFTVLFLAVGGMIMFSTGSIGLKGSFVDTTPVVFTAATPTPAVEQGKKVTVHITGSNLMDSKIAAAEGLTVSNDKYTDTSIDFDVSASATATVGSASIAIVTGDGKDHTQPITIAAAGDAGGTPADDKPKTVPAVTPGKPVWLTPKTDEKIKHDSLLGYSFTFTPSDPAAGNYEWVLIHAETASEDFINKLTLTSPEFVGGSVASQVTVSPAPFNIKEITYLSADKLKDGDKYVMAIRGKNVDSTGANPAYSPYGTVSFTLTSNNTPPNPPAWTAPAISAELALSDLAKTEFKWTPGTDPDTKLPASNFQFAVVKGEVTDQVEIKNIFTGTEADTNKKYDFAWIVRWTEKETQLAIQKLLGKTDCSVVAGDTSIYVCNSFMITPGDAAKMKAGQKYTAIVQQSDGKDGSTYATLTFSVKTPENCAANEYYITDSKNSGCKKIPSFKGAFVQTGFICGLYKTIIGEPNNSYRLSSDTKTSLQTNLDAGCGQKPVDNICKTKMTYLPAGKTMCEPLKVITDLTLTDDVCAQYTAEKTNASLSPDTATQLGTLLGGQCKPKICPAGKFLDGVSAPDGCKDVLVIPSKLSDFDLNKSCVTMKTIAESSDAIATYKIDQTTLDQIITVSKDPACSAAATLASADVKKEDKSSTQTGTCQVGEYFDTTCKKIPDLTILADQAEITAACTLYTDLLSKKIDGKMDATTTQMVQSDADNVLCNQAPPTLDQVTVEADKVIVDNTVKEDTTTKTETVAVVIPQDTSAADASATPPSLTTAPVTTSTADNTVVVVPEALASNLTAPVQAMLRPTARSLPKKTSETGPEMWIYSIGAIIAVAGSRKTKKSTKHKK